MARAIDRAGQSVPFAMAGKLAKDVVQVLKPLSSSLATTISDYEGEERQVFLDKKLQAMSSLMHQVARSSKIFLQGGKHVMPENVPGVPGLTGMETPAIVDREEDGDPSGDDPREKESLRALGGSVEYEHIEPFGTTEIDEGEEQLDYTSSLIEEDMDTEEEEEQTDEVSAPEVHAMQVWIAHYNAQKKRHLSALLEGHCTLCLKSRRKSVKASGEVMYTCTANASSSCPRRLRCTSPRKLLVT